jgi:hypothetical protein
MFAGERMNSQTADFQSRSSELIKKELKRTEAAGERRVEEEIKHDLG